MSADNSIARSGREADPKAEGTGFEIPPEVATRYEVRVVEGAGGGEQRLGLFRPGDRDNPAIEITDNRIVARSEDAETIASLVKIAQHNGWDRIDVDGSPEFRKAVWTAATREGLTVSGYEATFAEQERMEALRRDAVAKRGGEKAVPAATVPTPAVEPAKTVNLPTAPREASAQDRTTSGSGNSLSDGDRRLLLDLSRHTEDHKALYGQLGKTLDTFQREVQFERIDLNRAALDSALERALESPTLVNAFARSGYEPEALRQMGKGGEWDGEVANAIYLVRSGLNRADVDHSAVGIDHHTESPRFKIDRWDPQQQARVIVGQTDSPAEALRIFKSETDTHALDTLTGKTLGTTEWVNDGSFPRWHVRQELDELIAREAESQRAEPLNDRSRAPEPEPQIRREEREHEKSDETRREGEELAELFLNGGPDTVAGEPRLANALQAQAAMEQHLGEVFDGDASQVASASFESRKMISDVLRRGLDVSVREPTPVRQIEAMQTHPDLER